MTRSAKVKIATMMAVWFHSLMHKDRRSNQAFMHAGGTDADVDKLLEESERGPLLNPRAPASQTFTQWCDDGIYTNYD